MLIRSEWPDGGFVAVYYSNIIKIFFVPDDAERRHGAYGEPIKEKCFRFSLKNTFEAMNALTLSPVEALLVTSGSVFYRH